MRIGMIAPQREKCGVNSYTSALVAELRGLAEVAYVADPAAFRAEMNDVDLVHIQHEYFVFGGVAPWKNRFPALLAQIHRPVVMTVHEIVEPTRNPVFSIALGLTNRAQFMSSKIRRLIVHTERDRRRLGKVGAETDRIRVIRHGVPTAPTLPPRDGARCSLQLDSQFVVTIYGFIARKKGHLAALEAMEGLDESYVLLIAGGKHPDDTTGYVDEVTARVNDLGVRARITGYLSDDEVAAVMSASDLILAPFIDTSGSGSMAMAFTCGKPILASDIDAHMEILGDTPDAVQVTGIRAADLRGAIRSLAADGSRLEGLSMGARRYAETHSFGHSALRTADVYREVLSETQH